MQAPNPVIELLSSRVLRLSNTLALYASRKYREEFGLTLPEWRALSIIGSCEPTTAGGISRILVTDKAWVGLSVEKLVQRGYVTRVADERDGRRALLGLTPSGRTLYGSVLAVARRRQRRLMATLPDGAADVLVASLERLQEEAERMLGELGAEHTATGRRRKRAA